MASVEAGSPASDAGLKRGDVIVAVDGQAVDDAAGVDFRIGVKPIGGVASLTLMRAGKTVIVPMKLSAPPETTPRSEVRLSSRSPLKGAQVMNLSPAVIDELSLDAHALGAGQGVVVADVAAEHARCAVRIAEGRRDPQRQWRGRFATPTASSKRPLNRPAAGISPSPAPAR